MSNPNENHSRLQPAVEGTDVVLAHGAHLALAQASFVVPGGRTTAVIGPNGSGKSTLLHAIAGLHPLRSGRMTVLGGVGVSRREVAYVPQHLHANAQLPVSAREVVTMGRYVHLGPVRRLRAPDRAAVDRAMERLGVTDLGRRQLSELSGGERQRVLVAQALAQDATLLLLDEPLTALDLPSQERIQVVMDEERAAGRTVVASTHSLADAASADHLLLLDRRLVAQGPPDTVLTEAHLNDAYGAMIVKLDEATLVLDDTPHHHPN